MWTAKRKNVLKREASVWHKFFPIANEQISFNTPFDDERTDSGEANELVANELVQVVYGVV
jgi:hypothetical protein